MLILCTGGSAFCSYMLNSLYPAGNTIDLYLAILNSVIFFSALAYLYWSFDFLRQLQAEKQLDTVYFDKTDTYLSRFVFISASLFLVAYASMNLNSYLWKPQAFASYKASFETFDQDKYDQYTQEYNLYIYIRLAINAANLIGIAYSLFASYVMCGITSPQVFRVLYYILGLISIALSLATIYMCRFVIVLEELDIFMQYI